MPNNITTIFFDMGSTLVHWPLKWQGVYHRVFKRAGFDLPLDDVEAAISESWAQAALEDAHAEFENSLEASRAWQRIIEERVMQKLNIRPDVREDVFWGLIQAFEDPATYQLYPEALPTLQQLQNANFRLAIISNWSWHLPALCDALGITPFFEQIFTSARLGYQKPNPKIFQHALQIMQIQPDQALHVGDSLSADVGGAGQVGIQALWLVRPNEQPLYDEQKLKLTPTQRTPQKITDLTEIINFVGKA